MQGYKLLLVEDEPLLSRIIEEMLRGLGFRVALAQSGQEAIATLEQEPFDLMLLDVRLPDMSGLQMLDTLCKTQFSVPTILLTAYQSEAENAESLHPSVEAVLLKPFDWDLLLATIRRILSIEPYTSVDCRERVDLPERSGSGTSYETPPERAWVTISSAEDNGEWMATVGQVIGGNEMYFSLMTAPVSETPTRVKVQYPGKDGQYRFRADVIDSVAAESMGIWVLNRPRSVQRIQRRRFPRLEAEGHVTLIPLDQRVMRAVQADLIDVSERGLQVCASTALNKGTPVQVVVDGALLNENIHFVVQGAICHAVGMIHNHTARYHLGVTLKGLPIGLRQQLRSLSKLALIQS